MPEIRVLVADDEPLARRGVSQLLAMHADFAVVGESRNGPETLRALNELKPDLLFLDVEMPEMNGFEVLRAHATESMEVIFVTAHEQFAVLAFDAQAIDYLVKPLNVPRFEAALSRIRERLSLRQAADLAGRYLALPRRNNACERLIVSTGTGDLIIPAAAVDWISAEDYYTRLHVGGKSYLLRESLSSLEMRLDRSYFVRTHRTAIVQLDRVRSLRNSESGCEAILRDGSRVPVSRRRRALFNRLLRQS